MESNVEDVGVDFVVHPEALKNIAKEVRSQKANVIEQEVIDMTKVNAVVSLISEQMIMSAQNGEMEMLYSLKGFSRSFMKAVASSLRKKYPAHLIIIEDSGTNILELNWSGNSQV